MNSNGDVEMWAGVGVQMIAGERRRQVVEKGYSPSHDREEHGDGSLLTFARMILEATEQNLTREEFERERMTAEAVLTTPAVDWTWRVLAKHSDRVSRLRIAGALVAAELDRLLGAGGSIA